MELPPRDLEDTVREWRANQQNCRRSQITGQCREKTTCPVYLGQLLLDGANLAELLWDVASRANGRGIRVSVVVFTNGGFEHATHWGNLVVCLLAMV
jgi:hypothetical protein